MIPKTEQVLGEKIKRGEFLSTAEQIQQNNVVTMRNMVAALQAGVDRVLWDAPVLISIYFYS